MNQMYNFPTEYYQLFFQTQNYVLLETSKFDQENWRTFLFLNPVDIISVYNLSELPKIFNQIERYTTEGYYLAGYFSYECGFHFERSTNRPLSNYPLAWFGVYAQPLIFNHQTGCFEESVSERFTFLKRESCDQRDYKLKNLKFDILRESYLAKIDRIKEYIKAGDAYQINFTGKYLFQIEGSLISFYRDLKRKQPVAYGALINDGSRDVLCFSPELFFKMENGRITAKPMKGTAPRGKTPDEDARLADWLADDEKNRAENLMILDLLRNDLGRIAATGSVQAPQIFEVERFQTLLQMTSTVTGVLLPGLTYYDIFKSLFPCGSVTGAPKIRAMQIIDELEPEPRGIYTGAIGYFGPDGEGFFNVPIRTLVIENGCGVMGVGSGIVFDSNPENEYQECLLKAKFLTEPDEPLELIESILWENEYWLLERHLNRLKESAHYFDYPFPKDSIRISLEKNNRQLMSGLKYKVRLKLNAEGEITVENTVIDLEPDISEPLLISIASQKVDSGNRFLYHKTTRRQMYDEMFREFRLKGFAEVIFLNEKDQVTEGAISNIFIEKDGCWFTPPVECGLLNGVYRSFLLDERPNTKEKVITIDDFRKADLIYICNSVRGILRVRLVEEGSI